MKLGALKTTIRDMREAPKIQFRLGTGHVFHLALQKGPLIEQLDQAFPEGRGHETNLAITQDGYLTMESGENQG